MTYRSRAELETVVTKYLRDWWRTDLGVAAEVAARPGLAPALEAVSRIQPVATTDVYLDGDDWTPSREATQARIAAAMIGHGRRPSRPCVYFTIGPMGSGKTTRLRPIVDELRARSGATPESLSRVAADEVRELLPEYSAGLGSLAVQDEAFLVTYDRIFPEALAAGQDIVYDTIGRLGGGFSEKLRELKNAGYTIHVLAAQCPLDVCRQRADERALENGRLVDAAIQDRDHDEPAAALKHLRAEAGLLDGWVVFDTSRTGAQVSIVEGSDNWCAIAGELHATIATS